MRILLTISINVLILSSIYAQCLYTIVDNTFSFECISGETNGARIGIDSVVYIATGTGTVEVAPPGIFGAFKNGIYNESFSYDVGDAIKIKPISNGLGALTLESQEPGCMNSSFFAKRACTISLPVVWLSKPSSKLINNNQTHITWSVATQLNNEKYIIEHSTDGRNFSPIGEIEGNGTSNETKHYEFIHT